MHAAARLPTVAALLLALSACRRATPVSSDAGASVPDTVELSLRVPAGLTVARALDTLTVGIDPDTLGATEVTAHAGRTRGIEAHARVFARGSERAVSERTFLAPGTDFAAVASAWSAQKDGVPLPDTRYVVEVELVLFETDVPPSAAWEPRGGRFDPLWTRTLRQAEE
jgi:hypothetical protein